MEFCGRNIRSEPAVKKAQRKLGFFFCALDSESQVSVQQKDANLGHH